MKNQNKDIWVGVEDLENDKRFQELSQQEFVELPVIDALSDEKTASGMVSNRRDFLKYLGFGLGAATVAAGCDIPVKRAIPYVVKPDEIVPGVANYYASSFVNGGDYCSVLVKTREGRPIKIEGNTLSGVTKGGTNARTQASVLDLYDTNRLSGPRSKVGGSWEEISWEDLDKTVKTHLAAGTRTYILTGTIMSPVAKAALEAFMAKYPGATFISYDAVSSSAMLQANEECFAQKVIPSYQFDKADVIVSFGADFLGTWISPVEYAGQYAERRKIGDVKNPQMSRHIQVESAMTLTGSNADNRILVKPSEQDAAIANLYNEVAGLTGGQRVNAPAINEKAMAALKAVAGELAASKGKSLVVSGSNNTGAQVLVNKINDLLENYGNTLEFTHASLQRQGIDANVQGLIRDMNSGSVGTVILWGCNPAFDLPNTGEFKSAFEKVKMKVSFSGQIDETTSLCDFVAPAHHYLESWGDAEPKKGSYSLIQPTISPLFNTRQGEESLLRWASSEKLNTEAEQPFYEYLKAHWEANVFPMQNEFASFSAFWDNTLHDGVLEIPQETVTVSFAADVNTAASRINKPENTEMEISFFETVNIGGGQYANNPWLQELPDPVNRCVWGNYLAVPVAFDGVRSFNALNDFNEEQIYGTADKAEVEINGVKHIVTVVRQFGQMQGTVSMALGYGRKDIGMAVKGVGQNVYPWLSIDANGNTRYYATGVQISGKIGTDDLACVQYHHTLGVTGQDKKTGETINADEAAAISATLGVFKQGFQGGLTDRSIVFNTNVNELPAFTEELHHKREHFEKLNKSTIYPYDKYKEEIYEQGHHWGMYVDLNACIGCGACAIACMAENNVPVVGKKEVYRHHEMTWLRIDRYFYGDHENPNVVYQPMMCQHCDNAPCENVCPVSATNHSSEGLNQMAYNRCIGTRYCANNCPYKVRRFNWLDYTTADLFGNNEVALNGEEVPFGADNLTRMVLNPDVTVRSRGVMEKCSFCIQRIQEGKLTAKREMRKLRDSDVRSACQTACPTGAITFGDMNNKESEVYRKTNSPLAYQVLEEVNVRPSVAYSVKVNNRDEKLS